MNIVISKLLTGLLSEKILKAVLLKLGDYFIKKSDNKLDDEIWAEVKKALKLGENMNCECGCGC